MVSGKELTFVSEASPGRSTGTMGEAPWALFPKGTPRGAAGLQKRRWAKRPSVASGDSPQLRLTRWRVEVGPFVPETWRIDGTARGPDGGSQGHPAAPRSTPQHPTWSSGRGPRATGDVTAGAVQTGAPVGRPDPLVKPRPSATTLSPDVAGRVPVPLRPTASKMTRQAEF